MRNKLDSARTYLRQVDLAFGYMASFPLAKLESDRYILSWSVIRYIDGIIDSTASNCEKNDALGRYIKFTDNYIANSVLPKVETEIDSFMAEYLRLETISKIKTIDCFRNILRSFEIDISRQGQILTWDDYNKYLVYRSDSVLELYYRLLFRNSDDWIKQLAHHYARVFQYVDDVLDLFDDIKVGQINVTKDEMATLGLNDISDIANCKEKVIEFCKKRREFVANHFLMFIEILRNQNNLSVFVQRYLEESIGYNILPIINDNFYPGTKLVLPFEDIVKGITKTKRQTALYRLLHFVIFIYSLPHWYVNSKIINKCKLFAVEYSGFL